MKNFIRIIIFLIVCGNYTKSQAQQLSTTDLQIVKDIQQGIISLIQKSNNGFKDLIINGVVAKDTDVILYNAKPIEFLLESKKSTELLHAGKYNILNYFNQKKNIYAFSYSNPHDVLLAEKAIEELSYKLGSDWKLIEVKVDSKDYTTGDLYYNEKKVGYYEKQKDNTVIQLSFIAEYTDDEDISTTTIDTFADSLSKNLDKIDLEILTPDTVNVVKIQKAFNIIIGKGENGFPGMVFEETGRDKTMINYRVTPENNMKAQTYEGVHLQQNNESYYVCGYNNPANVAIARSAMAGLKNCKNAVWKIENVKTANKGLVKNNIFANGKYVAYTYFISATNKFYISVKNQKP
jgi:hypothetical protein